MRELLGRLRARPGIAAELVVASLFANVLALASSVFAILVLNRYVAHGVDSTLATLTAGVVLAIGFEFAFRRLRLHHARAISVPKDRILADGAFAQLVAAKAAAIETLPVGLKREIVAGTEAVQSAYGPANLCAILDVPMALVFVVALFLLNGTIGLVVTVFLAIVLLATFALQASLRGPNREQQAAAVRRGGLIATAIAAADAIRAFNAQPFLRRLWRDEAVVQERLKGRIAARQATTQLVNSALQSLLAVAVTAIGAILVVRNQLSVGAMIGANILAARALAAAAKVGYLGQEFARARQALESLREFGKVPVERERGTKLVEVQGEIELRDLGFVHARAAIPLFESLNLGLTPGTILVVAGGNGTGKTTLARLLLGLIEPRRGQILVDGVDLQQLSPDWWRQQVVYLPQEPRFLNGTLRDNLLAANPGLGTADLDRLIDASGLRGFVDKSAGGLDSPVLNGGDNLSLGIRRRLALARALANDGQIGVFDEPTEGLDADGAAHVYRLMNDLARRGRTIIAFSHDPFIVKGAHVVVDLNAKPVPRVAWLRAAGGETESRPDLKEAGA